jgi:hypothetical protein
MTLEKPEKALEDKLANQRKDLLIAKSPEAAKAQPIVKIESLNNDRQAQSPSYKLAKIALIILCYLTVLYAIKATSVAIYSMIVTNLRF